MALTALAATTTTTATKKTHAYNFQYILAKQLFSSNRPICRCLLFSIIIQSLLLFKLHVFRKRCSLAQTVHQTHLFNQSRMKYKNHPNIMMMVAFFFSLCCSMIDCTIRHLLLNLFFFSPRCCWIFVFSWSLALTSHIILPGIELPTIFSIEFFLITTFFRSKIFYLFILMLLHCVVLCVFFSSLARCRLFI